jgi:hypothetical protein
MDSYSLTNVGIHFINGSSDTDDKIIIKKYLNKDGFDVTYTDYNVGVPVTHRLSMQYNEVLDYIYLVLKNQSMDIEGFKEIQVSVPAVPRLLVSADNMKDLYYREHFLHLISEGLKMLGKTEKVEGSKNRYREHLKFYD